MYMHYVFGMTPDFGGKPWSYIHYLAIKSAALVNKPEHIYFWYEHEPTGEWWEQTKPYLTLKQTVAPKHIYGRPLLHPAHKSDVLRLQALKTYGGVYCDCDVLCLRPFSELQHVGFWMGKQHADYGLCNATMGGTAHSEFLYHWMAEYKTFRSTGRDQYWDEHSVKTPYRLAHKYPNAITIFDQFHFFEPDWNRIQRVFDADDNLLSRAYSVHLWETFSWPWLSQLTPQTINKTSEIGRRLLATGAL